MANATHRTCATEGCDSPHFARGFCNIHYYRQRRAETKVLKYALCAWCGERKTLSEMRHPDSSRGKTPTTCHACRTSNPNKAWCDWHMQPHERSQFSPRHNVRNGLPNICVAAQSESASIALGLPDLECVSCSRLLSTWNFTGGRSKAKACRDCVQQNIGRRWCMGCESWEPEGMFHRTGKNNRFLTVRCKPCRSAHEHGMTVRAILDRQGASRPECAACGGTDMLQIDHDHKCCPSAKGCEKCVRGYLCHQCNTSEGLLVTAERARKLANYMERWAVALNQ